MDRDEAATREIRRDNHLALGCGFAFALIVISALIIYILVSA
ncbi:MAG TPA: hypothetical protein VKZ96_11130 [Thermomicrobiales bacterium]|nr:hypothetical protein [Thermomicrobiales bacterium]